MYTQCPQCNAAFRITVGVLQQARGQVRCGSCDHAFNALDHLSDEPPAAAHSEPETPSADEDLERSQLLETLDRLAGTEDVRIEDTGVEWRVVDDDDALEDALEEEEADPDATGEATALADGNTGSSSMRWIVEDPDAPETIGEDIPDTAETTQNEILGTAAFEDASSDAPDEDEPRYDDNTLLPDDFEEQHQYSAPTPQRRATDHFEFVVEDDASPQSDLELSEPEDWTDLLDDLAPAERLAAEAELTGEDAAQSPPGAATDDAAEAPVDAAMAEATVPESEPSDSDSEEPVGPDPDREEEIALVASQLDDLLETMGSEPVQALADSMDDQAQDPADSDDSSSEMGSEPAAEAVADAVANAPLENTDDPSAEPPDEALETEADALSLEVVADAAPEDDDSPAESTDEAPKIEADGANDEAVANADGESPDDALDEAIDEAIDDIANEVAESGLHAIPDAAVTAASDADARADAESAQEADAELTLDSGDVPEFVDLGEAASDATSDADETAPSDAATSEAAAAAEEWAFDAPLAEDDDAALDAAEEEAVEEAAESVDVAATDADDLADDLADDSADEPADNDELADLVAMTGNMPIDADMLRAMQDSDFAATMTNADGSPIVETIVMEGDEVSDALADRELSGQLETLTDPASFIDTYITKRGKDTAGQRPAGRALALAAGLLVLLIAQFVHHARESLATIGAFNQTIGPLYQMLGDPITPNWDIRGWQFEATNGSTDENDSVLTIYSRISNRGEDPLPYPIVHVALTDRFEEVIGSRMLDPSEYLAGNADPNRSVPANANFTAVITIAAPADEATGFKLNVCYPASGGQLRCAIEDFKTP